MTGLKTLAIIGLLGISLGSTATAQTAFSDADKAVQYRQKAFSIMRDNFAEMAAMVKGEVSWDNALFAERAADFAKLSTIPWAAFTTAGAMPGNDTDALPDIWDNWDDFQSRAQQLQSDAAALAKVSQTGDADSMRSAFMTAAKNCKACHDQYKD